jgi:hypothetical protein
MWKKSLAVAVILLFIGVAIAPSINITVVRAVSNDEFIEVTSEACGIKGYDDTTVKLTKQQYSDLEQYLVEFRAKLNQTTTKEEAVPIFNEAVIELNKYGLLPKGMSVEQAQNYLIGIPQIMRDSNLFDVNLTKSKMENYNYLCLVTGETSNTYTVRYTYLLTYLIFYFINSFIELFVTGVIGVIAIPLIYLGFIFYFFSPNLFYKFCDFIVAIISIFDDALFTPLLDKISVIFDKYWAFTEKVYNIIDRNPIAAFCTLGFGGQYQWSNGWVWSYGLLGQKKWEGEFQGTHTSPMIPFKSRGPKWTYPGVILFDGIKLSLESGEKWFIGSALAIGLDMNQ